MAGAVELVVAGAGLEEAKGTGLEARGAEVGVRGARLEVGGRRSRGNLGGSQRWRNSPERYPGTGLWGPEQAVGAGGPEDMRSGP